MDLSVIIASYNTKDLLKNCLNSLPSFIEVIVVDNVSKDGSVEMLEQQFPQVRLIKNTQNLGFAKANNQGIKLASGRYILLLNSDTVVPPGTLEEMIKFMEQDLRVGIATCRVELADGSLDPASHRGFPTPWAALTYFTGLEKFFPKSRIFGQYHLTYLPLDEIHTIDSPSGAFFLMRRDMLDEIGLLDEHYFMYAEDIDLSWRAKKASWKVMFHPFVKIIHYKKKSGREKGSGRLSNEAKEIRKRTIGYFYDTMGLFYDKNLRTSYPLWLCPLIFLGINLRKNWELLKLRFK